MLGSTLIRYSFLHYPDQRELITEKFDYRVPTGAILFGTEIEFRNFIQANSKVVRNRTEWIFMFDEFLANPTQLNVSFSYFRSLFPPALCCSLKNASPDPQNCNPSSCHGNPTDMFLQKLAFVISEALNEVDANSRRAFRLSCTTSDRRTGESGFTKIVTDALNKVNKK